MLFEGLARFAASLVVACVMGWLWLRLGRPGWLRPPVRPSFDGDGKGAAFWGSVRHDVMHAGGFLVVGAMAAATLKTVVPASWLHAVASIPAVSILALFAMQAATFGRGFAVRFAPATFTVAILVSGVAGLVLL